MRTGLEELVNRLLGTDDDRPLKRRGGGNKIGVDGLPCPLCSESKLGIDYKPHPHGNGREWHEVAFCRVCQATLPTVAKAVGMSPVEVMDKNRHLPAKYPVRAPEEPPSLDEVEEWHRELMAGPERLRYLTETRGLSLDVIRANLIGHDGERYTVPVLDHSGPFVVVENVRRYLPNPGPDEPKWLSLARPGAWLYPDLPDDDRLIVCEGEWDCLLLRSLGFPAITNTAGAETWRDEWSERIGPRRFAVIVYDRDRAGVAGSKKVAGSLRRVGLVRSITVVRLPFLLREKHGLDVSDYFFKSGKTADDFRQLLRDAYRKGRTPGRARPGIRPQRDAVTRLSPKKRRTT